MAAQGTVSSFDAGTGSGSVLLDDGLRLPFGQASIPRSGCEHCDSDNAYASRSPAAVTTR